jgi:8-oxo-dGTP pyrophosphatase MutT (NUDIX family)
MIPGTIRPLVLCLIKNKDKILVMDGYDSKKDQEFYRPLGGGIELSEYGKEALRREFQEELNTDLENVKYVTTLENIFTFNGEQGHEIVLVFEGELINKDLYHQDGMDIIDSKDNHKAFWKNISDFKEKRLILYPDGILSYL